MIDTLLVSLAVTAGILGLAGVPLRCWQFGTGRFRSQIPRTRFPATFSLFSMRFLTPNALAWTYALYTAFRDFSCTSACAQAGISSTIAVGCWAVPTSSSKVLLTARRRSGSLDWRLAPVDS